MRAFMRENWSFPIPVPVLTPRDNVQRMAPLDMQLRERKERDATHWGLAELHRAEDQPGRCSICRLVTSYASHRAHVLWVADGVRFGKTWQDLKQLERAYILLSPSLFLFILSFLHFPNCYLIYLLYLLYLLYLPTLHHRKHPQ
jgi:hypothetical protein